jgi:hypothetical protein
VALIVLYKVVASPLRQARYSSYHGAPLGQGWLALWGVLVWLALVTFFAWLAWQHWPEVQGFFEQLASSLRDFIENRPAASVDPVQATIGLLPFGSAPRVTPAGSSCRTPVAWIDLPRERAW